MNTLEHRIMKVADLYIRVSTDEQAEKGYSQRDQEERLKKYCEINKISVRKILFEDHSAKTFERPEWKKLLIELKRFKKRTNLVLFTKWDRFSRNAGDAYHMINVLKKMGIEPQAIEQPLDLSVPENKMMLAFYLAAPEVENDRRALNTTNGMRRAKKEGRWMGPAPTGYKNKITEDGKKYIGRTEPEASLLTWAFEELAKGRYNTQQVYNKAKEKGLEICKAHFWKCLRNQVYCGKIIVPQYNDEEEYAVKGQHEPLISEYLFNRVQDVLDGRKRDIYRTKIETNEEFPLRGFLLCPNCLKPLTASKSKGYAAYYSYYHCGTKCKQRHPADVVNKAFEQELAKFMPDPSIYGLYITLLKEGYHEKTKGSKEMKSHIISKIKTLENQLSAAREMLVNRDIDPDDFRALKGKYTTEISELEAKFRDTESVNGNINELIEHGIGELKNLSQTYRNFSVERKRRLISSIYPEKLTFTGFGFRTGRTNNFLNYIYLVNSKLEDKKKWTSRDFKDLSTEVRQRRFELPRPCEHNDLNVACLPVSTPPRGFQPECKCNRNFSFLKNI